MHWLVEFVIIIYMVGKGCSYPLVNFAQLIDDLDSFYNDTEREEYVQRIAQGEISNHYRYPFVVMLEIYVIGLEYLYKISTCTGALLSRSVLIVAAHCFFHEEINGTVMGVAVKLTVNKMDNDLIVSEVVASRMANGNSFIHFDMGVEFGDIFDLALISVDQPFDICSNNMVRETSVVKLPIHDLRGEKWVPFFDPVDELNCTFIGYGESEKQQSSPEQIVLRELPNVNLEVSLPNELTSKTLGDYHKGRACSGDSGGPLVCKHVGEDFVRLYGTLMYSSMDFTETILPHCFSDEGKAQIYDSYLNIQNAIPFIQYGLRKMGKLQEVINDNEICDQYYRLKKNENNV